MPSSKPRLPAAHTGRSPLALPSSDGERTRPTFARGDLGPLWNSLVARDVTVDVELVFESSGLLTRYAEVAVRHPLLRVTGQANCTMDGLRKGQTVVDLGDAYITGMTPKGPQQIHRVRIGGDERWIDEVRSWAVYDSFGGHAGGSICLEAAGWDAGGAFPGAGADAASGSAIILRTHHNVTADVLLAWSPAGLLTRFLEVRAHPRLLRVMDVDDCPMVDLLRGQTVWDLGDTYERTAPLGSLRLRRVQSASGDSWVGDVRSWSIASPSGRTVAAFTACVHAGRCSAAHINDQSLGGYPPTYGKDARCNYGVDGKGNHPINCVAPTDAVEFCRTQDKRLPTPSARAPRCGFGDWLRYRRFSMRRVAEVSRTNQGDVWSTPAAARQIHLQG